jgi:hypothetical protein
MLGWHFMKSRHSGSRLFDISGYGGSGKLGIRIVVGCVSFYLHLRKHPRKVLYRVWEARYVLLAGAVLPSAFVVERTVDVSPSALGFLRSNQHSGACRAECVE